MKNYENDYFAKIEYWNGLLAEAIRMRDIYEIDHCHNKLDFFIQKQFDLNAKLKNNWEKT
jgi:hypothetical protein